MRTFCLCLRVVCATDLPLRQQVPPRRLLLLVGGVDEHVAGGLGLRQPAQELLQVQVEPLQELQGRIQGRLPVRGPGQWRGGRNRV